ncbi:MAG TPA: chromosome segregation protein SMC, partial [Terriglobales bacterium]
MDSNRQVLDSAAADLAAAQQEQSLAQEEAAVAVANLAQLERQQEDSRVGIMEVVAAAANLRNQLIQAEERLAAVDRETARVEAEISAANSQVLAFGGQRGQLALEFESVSQRLAGVTKEIGEVRDLLDSKRRAETEAKRRLDGLRAEYATALGKKGSLEAVIAEHGYSTESVRRLFQSGAMQGGLAPAGVLADFLEVETRYEGVVEDFLRDELNYVVVKSWDAADEGLRLLRSDVDGRATFLVHPNDAQAKFSFLVDENTRPAPPSHPIVPLKSCIRVLNGFGKSLEVILPKLRDGYIVPDSGLGRDQALENPDAFFLSAQSGECFHNVTVTGGKQRAEGPLSMKRELRDVVRILTDLEEALRTEEHRVLTLGREITELTSLLDRLEHEKRDAEKQAMTSGHMLQQLDAEMSRVNERLGVASAELQRLAADRAEQQASMEARQNEIAVAESRRTELEQQTAAGQASLAALRERRDTASHHAAQQIAKVATLEERHRAAAAVLERIEGLVAEMAERQQALRAQFDSSLVERQQRETENQQLADQVVSLEQERNAAEVRESLLQFETE